MVDKLTPMEAEVVELPKPAHRKEAPEDSYGTAPKPVPKRSYVGLWVCFGLLVIALCTFSVFATLFNVRLERTDTGLKIRMRSPEAESAEETVRSLPNTGAEFHPGSTDESFSGEIASLHVDTGEQGELTPAELYAAVSPSVVCVELTSAAYGTTCCTGVVITDDGYILSATGGMRYMVEVNVILPDGTCLTAMPVAEDRLSGVCLLKVDAEGLTPARFAEETPGVGQPVYCICNPYGTVVRSVLSDGLLSAVQTVELDGIQFHLLQTSAPMQSSGYGAPIFDAGGRILGLTSPVGGWFLSGVEDPCFGVSTEDLQTILARFGSAVTDCSLQMGIRVEEIPEDYSDLYGFPGSLWITEIARDSCMYGILSEYDVITEVDGTAVDNLEDYTRAVNEHRYGDMICFTIYRNGQYYFARVLLSGT